MTMNDEEIEQSRSYARPLWDDGAVFWGMLLGLVLGAVLALLRLPANVLRLRANLEQIPHELRNAVQTQDPMQASLEAEKEAAQRRRQDLTARR